MLEELLNVFMNGENLILTLTFFALVIVFYAIFVYYFYRFLAKKNIISLNLNQYNTYGNPALVKFFAAFFYILEYIVLLPIMTFFWFGVLAILTLVLSEGMSVSTVLVISAALVAAVRVTAFVSEDLAKDLAKMLPFALLSISITSGVAFFDAASLTARISEIPTLFNNVPYYLLFVVGIELFMRIATFLLSSMNILRYANAEAAVIEESTETE